MPKRNRTADEQNTKQIQAKTKVVSVKFTPDQYNTIAQRADECGVRVAVWMRLVLHQAASKPVNNGHLRIRQPDGTMT